MIKHHDAAINSARTLACLTVHTERLCDVRVWNGLRVALAIAGRNVPWTFFSVAPLHPFYRNQPGFDEDTWLRRLRWLARAGHEIQLHSHFYGRDGAKRLDPSPSHVAYCLKRDAGFLRSHGFAVDGFVSGGWTVIPGLWQMLVENDFTFDMSLRSYESPNGSPRDEGCLVKPEYRNGRQLLLIPTTSTLRKAISSRVDSVSVGPESLAVVYLHDYDLISPLKVLALFFIIHRWRHHAQWTSASELAASLRAMQPQTA